MINASRHKKASDILEYYNFACNKFSYHASTERKTKVLNRVLLLECPLLSVESFYESNLNKPQ